MFKHDRIPVRVVSSFKHDTAYRHAPETLHRYGAGESCLVYWNHTAIWLAITLHDKILQIDKYNRCFERYTVVNSILGLLDSEDGGSKFFRNLGKCLPADSALASQKA
jgi:hypothetical protein